MKEGDSSVNRATPIRDLPELLTADEAARWLGISKWSTYDLCRRRVLQSTRLGRHVRIKRIALAELASRADTST